MPRSSRKANTIQAVQPGCMGEQFSKGTTSPVPVRIYKVAVYVRLSVEDIRKKISDSIGTQKTMLMNFIQEQPDLQLYEVYEDVNYTGTNFNRPGFARMIEDIQSGHCDCVLVKDLSRFGRSFEEMGHYLENVFPFLQVRFISVNDSYDSLMVSIDESGLIVPLKNLMNEVYARDISKKVQASFKAKSRRGEFCGSVAPYGYIKAGTSLEIDEEAATVVRQIFGWICEGMSDAGIAQKLNNLNITPPSRYSFEKGITKAKKHENTKFWYKSAIRRISENPAYTGVMASGKFQSNFQCGGGRITKNNNEWIITKNAHPAIIDSDIFENVLRIRETRRQVSADNDICVCKTGDTADNPNIFKGLIFCGDCGSHMTRRKRRSKYVFLCNVYEEVAKHACTPKTIRESALHTALYSCISCEISLAVDMTRIIEEAQGRASFRPCHNAADKRIEAIKKKLEQNRRFRGSLREDYKDGLLSEQGYKMIKSNYDDEKDKLQQELDEQTHGRQLQIKTLSPDNKWIAEIRRFEIEKQLSSEMVSAFVARINVFDGARIEVVMRYHDEFEALMEYHNDCREPGEASFAGIV